MTCASARDSLLVLLDGEMGAQSDLEGHVSGCAECRAEVASLRATQKAVERVLSAEPPKTAAGSFAALARRLDAELDGEGGSEALPLGSTRVSAGSRAGGSSGWLRVD